MSKAEAVKVLSSIHSKTLIRSIYAEADENAEYAGQAIDALRALAPNFEYPDWDNRTIAEFVRRFVR